MRVSGGLVLAASFLAAALALPAAAGAGGTGPRERPPPDRGPDDGPPPCGCDRTIPMDGTWRLEPLGTTIRIATQAGPSGECGTDMTVDGALGPGGERGPGPIRLACDEDGGYVGFGADGTVLQLSGPSTGGGLDVAERLSGTLHRPPDFTSADGQSKAIPVSLTFEAADAGQSSCLCRQVADQAAAWRRLHDVFADRDLIEAALDAGAPAYTRAHGWQRAPDGRRNDRSYDNEAPFTYYDMVRQAYAGPAALPDPNTGGGTPTGDVYSPAQTDPDTCEVTLPLARTPGGACDPAPLVDAAALHEGDHQEMCLSMSADPGTGLSDYAYWMNWPPNFAKDEMRAYDTAVATAEAWLDSHCRD